MGGVFPAFWVLWVVRAWIEVEAAVCSITGDYHKGIYEKHRVVGSPAEAGLEKGGFLVITICNLTEYGDDQRKMPSKMAAQPLFSYRNALLS